jgi:heme exporter protein C
LDTYGKGLKTLSIATVVVLIGAFALAAFFAPQDADQGIIQKIFYVHVPLALVALGGFVAGGVFALKHLRSGDRSYDLKSYVAIHLSLILAVGVLITGSIWGRGAWGVWWSWEEPMLVAFLIIFLLYATYQPLRFSIEDPERQARYASVFAVVAGVFVPINFASVRFAQESTSAVHPRTFDQTGTGLPVMLTFLVALAGMTLLFVTLWKFEMASKVTRGRVRSLRRRLAGEHGADFATTGRSAAPQVSA